jgi:hypothetical protein
MPVTKELDFFIEENNFGKGVDWYTSKFNPQYKMNGEASPNYTKAHLFKGVSYRMFKKMPDVKLIFLYRDPVERAISHYIHNFAIGVEQQSPEEALTKESNYVKTSLYHWQLQQYTKYYNDEQILVLNSDDLRYDRKRAMQKVYEFLGVSFYFDENIFEKDRHQSSKKTKRSWFNTLFLDTGIGKFLKKVASEEMKNFYKQATEATLKVPDFSDELKKKVWMFVDSDFRKFQSQIERLRR